MARWPTIPEKARIFSRIGYEPNPKQRPIHRSGKIVRQVVGAEGGGKSYVAAAEVAALSFWSDLIYLVGQTYINSMVEFNYLMRFFLLLDNLQPTTVSQPKQGAWSLTTRTGCRVETLSVERGAKSIISKGEEPDIFVLCEAGVITSASVLLASVRRATRARGCVLLVGTLKDNFGWYAKLVDELTVPNNAWLGETFSLPAWSNLVLYPGGRNDPEIKRLERIMPPDEFDRTIAARKAPSQALIFPEFTYARNVRDCPFDSSLPVWLWVDPGYFPSSYAVVVVQFHGEEVWQIDEIYVNMHTHRQVIEEARSRPWWPKVERIVMDVAGRQRTATGNSAYQVWQSETGIMPVGQAVGILDGIDRHRTFIAAPTGARLFVDPRCTGTLSEYGRYRRRADKDGNPLSDIPLDKDNHAMKATAYGLIDRYGFVDGVRGESVVTPLFKKESVGGVRSERWS